jgi:hypothetical protein
MSADSLALITLTHANLKVEMDIAVPQIAGFYRSPAHHCTHVVAAGGAIFPALESVADVRRLLTAARSSKEENGHGKD